MFQKINSFHEWYTVNYRITKWVIIISRNTAYMENGEFWLVIIKGKK